MADERALVRRSERGIFRFRALAHVAAAILLSIAAGSSAHGQVNPAAPAAPRKETAVTKRAVGMFDVKLTPEAPTDSTAEPALGKLSIDKQFHGDLSGSSRGTMLAAGTAVKGSAGYVAIEKVSGTLEGKRGTFYLQHSGTMDRGSPSLVIRVVPDSGTDELAGLSGTMNIIIASDGTHSYEFDYALGGR